MKCPNCGSEKITVVNRPVQLEEKTKSGTMSNFSKIIKDLRKNTGLNQKDFAKNLGLQFYIVGNWEQGRSEPSLEDILLISKTFNVSADYLLGLEDDFGQKNENDVVNKILSEELTKEEIEMIKKIRVMDINSQIYIKAQIDALSDTAKSKQKGKV